jgi:hypothetical protein
MAEIDQTNKPDQQQNKPMQLSETDAPSEPAYGVSLFGVAGYPAPSGEPSKGSAG